MPRIESVLREEIMRLARKVVRKAQAKTLEEVRRLKARVASLRSEVNALKRAEAGARARQRMARATEEIPAASGKVRLSPNLIKKLRKRLNISQPQLARLVGVSDAAVGFWESGKTMPRPEARVKLAALRKLGRRDVRRLLEEQDAAGRGRSAARRKRPSGSRRRRARGQAG